MPTRVRNRPISRMNPFLHVGKRNEYAYLKEWLHVARKKAVKFQGFVSIGLSKAEKKFIKENLLEWSGIHNFIVSACELGYKVSMTLSAEGEFYTVTLYGNHADNPNAGYAASIRHSDLLVAYSALAHVMREEGLTNDWKERFSIAGDDDW